MTIEEIYKNEEISVRSYHICKYNGLNSLLDLKKYYYKNKTFDKLRNCGKKTNEELINICNKYQEEYLANREAEIKKENPLNNSISNLTRLQREVINSFIFVNTNSLSVRSKNAILLHLKNNLKIKNFAEKIFLSESFNVQNIKNIGAKYVPELEVYISIVEDFIFEVNQAKDEKYIIGLKNKFLIQRTFDIPLIPSKILESESIFLLTDFLFNQNAFFDKTQTIIVKKTLKLYINQKDLTLDEIAKQVDLSRERIRQIRKHCLNQFFSKLCFISNFNDDIFQKYNIDITSSYIDININIVEKINNSNNTHFSKEFITYILYAYLNDNFTLIGNIEDVLQPKYFNTRNRHNWNNLYLVDKKLATEINFTSLTNDISSRISNKIEESYSFNFKSYLSKFLTNNKIAILNLLFPIAEKIVIDEFELYLDLDENLIFKRNTLKQAYEYSYEALEHLGKPSNVSDIHKKIIELHPNYITDEDKVRVSMRRTNGFVPVGRKSVFGLKKWEIELDNFKGGTIKDVVIEFIQDQNKPTHILSVIKYLDKFRENKDAKSVLTNLKCDPMKRFLIYSQGFIGLKNKQKQYNSKYESLPVQLGKTIIAKHKKGSSINDIKKFLKDSFDLDFEESKLILNNLKYFNENKRN